MPDNSLPNSKRQGKPHLNSKLSESSKAKRLNGKWVVVNGNFIKMEQKNSNLDQGNNSIKQIH